MYHNKAMSRQQRYYTLASLLDSQPKGLVKDSRHRLLWDYFMSSEKLQKLRISRRCYSLLNRAGIKPENLESFYRTYRLPRDAFFPLFLAVKSKWMKDRLSWKEKRKAKIEKTMARLPLRRKKEIAELKSLEKTCNPAGKTPLWKYYLYPSTIKRAGEFSIQNDIEWFNIYSLFLTDLTDRYQNFSNRAALRSEALLLLGFELTGTGEKPGKRKINERFRALSKSHHPDRGGNADVFRRLKTARDVLL